jgi:hypothetical protein
MRYRVYSVRQQCGFALPKFAFHLSFHHHGTGIFESYWFSVQADHIEALFEMTVPYTARSICAPRQWLKEAGDW